MRSVSSRRPMLELVPFTIGGVLELNGKRIEVLSAVHTVPAVGFAVDGGTDAVTGQPRGWWVYTSDTGPNPLLWERLRSMKVAHRAIETALSDEERQLARISSHLCPAALGQELAARLAASNPCAGGGAGDAGGEGLPRVGSDDSRHIGPPAAPCLDPSHTSCDDLRQFGGDLSRIPPAERLARRSHGGLRVPQPF